MSKNKNQLKESRLSKALKKNMKRRKDVRNHSGIDKNPKFEIDNSSKT